MGRYTNYKSASFPFTLVENEVNKNYQMNLLRARRQFGAMLLSCPLLAMITVAQCNLFLGGFFLTQYVLMQCKCAVSYIGLLRPLVSRSNRMTARLTADDWRVWYSVVQVVGGLHRTVRHGTMNGSKCSENRG